VALPGWWHSERWPTTSAPVSRVHVALRSETAPQSEGFQSSLVRAWPAFVDCRARLRTLLPFLTATIPLRARVIDLAAGIGCEAVALAELGYQVTANEINPALHRLAARRAQHWTDHLKLRRCDWRHIATEMGGERFGALLLLGNSFCLLPDEDERRQALCEFVSLCDTDAAFIVDLRNFKYILRARDAILGGRFRYSGRVMYCGKRISGHPIAISPDRVTFGYFGEDGLKRGTLDMVPLLVDDLIAACGRVGFRAVAVFSDLKPGIDESADFFTCVFRC